MIDDTDTPSKDQQPVYKVPGPIRRNAGLLAAVIAMLIAGPALTRVLEAYRAVVLEVSGDQMFVAREGRPPRWIPATDAKAGDMVEKESGTWKPEVVVPRDADARMLELFTRYQSSYEGIIVEIMPPKAPGQAYVAVVEEPATKKKRYVKLWADHLAEAAVDRWLRKTPGSWDPSLVDGPTTTTTTTAGRTGEQPQSGK